MKKFFQKKYLFIFLGLFCLSGIAPAVLFATGGLTYYQADPLMNYSDVVSQRGSTTIVNRSDKKYFVPNKTTPEWDAFAKNAPKYVSVSTCPDGTCGEGETAANCPDDCALSGGCGDGICDKSTTTRTKITLTPPKTYTEYDRVCVKKVRGWMWVPAVNVVLLVTNNATYTKCNDVARTVSVDTEWVLGSETWDAVMTSVSNPVTTCKDDCAAPPSAGCGVCGYANGALCPNNCNDGNFNMINCIYQHSYIILPENSNIVVSNTNAKPSLKKYLTASDALAVTAAKAYDTDEDYYYVAGRYTCDFDASSTNFCPAGSYCPFTGGLKPSTSLTLSLTNTLIAGGKTMADLQKTCDPGFFCPAAASYERPCPINTYSTGGATSTCTACPAGTKAMGRSTSAEMCVPAYKAGDGVCKVGDGTTGENPTNSPYDCPDASQAGTLWRGDGRCSGAETIAKSPSDCSCGDGYCNNGETYLSCLTDCACMDDVCGTTTYNSRGADTIYKEGKNCAISATQSVLNKSDCKNMNSNEVCGNGTCETGEAYSSSLGHIVCPLDCHCGNGSCGTGEFYSSTNATGSCNLDCKCGNGTCDKSYPYYESSSKCAVDCHCGDHVCNSGSPYYESSSNCSTDCTCGDNICSSGETTLNCRFDCATECDRDGKCDAGEYRATCIDCKTQTSIEY